MAVRILLVDDDILVLKALIRVFMDTEYEVVTAENGNDALDLMKMSTFDIIISDMRMPNMDGFQLLFRIKTLYPDTIRMILSGYSDERVVLKAVQGNVAKHYIFKPWDNDKLLETIRQILDTETQLKSSHIVSLVKRIDELPTIRASYNRILTSIENDAETKEIISLIEQDQSIATKLLQIVNSAFYGVKTGSVKQSVTYLGLSNVKRLILSTSIIDSLNQKKNRSSTVELLWAHAFKTNKFLNLIYEKLLGRKIPDMATASGLLHNVGHVLLINQFCERHLQHISLSRNENPEILEREKEAFGVDHQLVGGYLLKWWELPFPIVEAALYHHDPFNENITERQLLYCLNLAQYYAWKELNRNVENIYLDGIYTKLGGDRKSMEALLRDKTL